MFILQYQKSYLQILFCSLILCKAIYTYLYVYIERESSKSCLSSDQRFFSSTNRKLPGGNGMHVSTNVSLFRHTVDAPWYSTSNGQLMLMTSVAVTVLLVFIVSVSIFLCRRAKRTKTSMGPM